MSRPQPRMSLIALTAVVCGLLLPAGAGAATVVNGDFETGNLSGWSVFNSSENGNWFAYAGTTTPLPGNPASEAPFFAPPQGNWAAISDEVEPDLAILYQDIALEPFYSHALAMTLYYRSNDPIAVPTPNTLDVPPPAEVMAAPPLAEGQENQQLRVDVIRPTAPIDTIAPADILATIFANRNGDPQVMAPTVFNADLSALAGQTVRLRVANAVRQDFFNTGVDAVSITSTPPSNEFSRGKVQLTPGTGGGFLEINVPGAGAIKAVDARTKIATATASVKKAAPKRIRRATKNAAAAGKVLVPLHPTRAGFKTLEQKGKLKLKVRVTYTPTGGLANTKSFKLTLKLARK